MGVRDRGWDFLGGNGVAVSISIMSPQFTAAAVPPRGELPEEDSGLAAMPMHRVHLLQLELLEEVLALAETPMSRAHLQQPDSRDP